MATAFKKGDKVTVKGTKTDPAPRRGSYVATHPGAKGAFHEVLLDGAVNTVKFRGAQISPA